MRDFVKATLVLLALPAAVLFAVWRLANYEPQRPPVLVEPMGDDEAWLAELDGREPADVYARHRATGESP